MTTQTRNAIASLVRQARRAGHRVISRATCNRLCLTTGAQGFSYLCSGFYINRNA